MYRVKTIYWMDLQGAAAKYLYCRDGVINGGDILEKGVGFNNAVTLEEFLSAVVSCRDGRMSNALLPPKRIFPKTSLSLQWSVCCVLVTEFLFAILFLTKNPFCYGWTTFVYVLVIFKRELRLRELSNFQKT